MGKGLVLDRKGVGERDVCIAIAILGLNLNMIPVYVRIFLGVFLIEFSLILPPEGVFLARYCLMRLENRPSYKTSAYGTFIQKEFNHLIHFTCPPPKALSPCLPATPVR